MYTRYLTGFCFIYFYRYNIKTIMDEYGNALQPQTPTNVDSSRADTTRDHALRTYSSDMAKALKQNQGSVIKIAMAEQARKNQVAEVPVETKKKRTWIILIVLSVLLGFSALGVAWYFGSPRGVTVEKPASLQDSMIFVEKEKVFSLSGGRSTILLNLKQAQKEMESNPGQMMNVYGVVNDQSGTRKAKFSDVATALGMETSKSFSVDTVKDFMLGIDSTEIRSSYFMIIESDSFDSLFGGMIAWEKTILRDTYDIFDISTVEAEANFTTKWNDKVIKNKDMRILYGESGETVLLYGYAENDIVILTDNQETFDRVLGRLQDRAIN